MATCNINYSATDGFTIASAVIVAKDDSIITFNLPSGWSFVFPSSGQYMGYQTPAAGDPVGFLATGGSRAPQDEFSGWNQSAARINVTHAGPGTQTYRLAIYAQSGKGTPKWYPVNLKSGARVGTDDDEIVVNNT